MLPGLHFKGLYERTVQFFNSLSPSDSSTTPTSSGPRSSPIEQNASLLQRSPSHSSESVSCTCPSCTATPQPPMCKELASAKRELAQSRLDAQKLEERCRTLEKALRDANDQLTSTREMGKRSLRWIRQGMPERSSYEDAPSMKHPRFRWAPSGDGKAHATPRRGSLSEQQSRSPPTASILDEEFVRRRGVETFMTKSDGWSGSQVIEMVQDLNSEILQFAASVTDDLAFDANLRLSASQDSRTMQNVSSRLGPQLVRFLTSLDHAQDPTFVQFALQSCVVMCISRALSSFCMVGSPGDETLTRIYRHLYMSEPQPTSSKWRSLTHRHLRGLYPQLEEQAVDQLVDTLVEWTSNVLSLTGGTPLDHKLTLPESIEARFGGRLQRLARAVYKWTQITREEIMSTNFEVILFEHGEVFHPQTMADVFADYGPSRGAVLCTTEFGLGCTTRRATAASTSPGRRMLLPPKVILESAVEIIKRG